MADLIVNVGGQSDVGPTNPFRYASVADMERRFGITELIQLSDPAALVIGEQRISDALDDAAAEIDLSLTGRYALPLATVPRVLVNICCDLAREGLYEERVTDRVQQRADAARKLLKQIRENGLALGLDVAQQPVATSGGPVADGPGRTFSRDTLGDFLCAPSTGRE